MADLPAALMKAAFAAGARIRHARVFYPNGLHLAGCLRAAAEFEPLLGSGDRPVVARLSKGVGTPGSLPDVLGLAFRVLDRADRPWDFVLTTTGRGPLGRLVITPARGWARAHYGCIVPYRIDQVAPTWLFADPDLDQPTSASLAAMNARMREDLVGFTLTASRIGKPPRLLGELVLRPVRPTESGTDDFDPVHNHPPEVTLVPAVVERLREFAYPGSRSERE
ncbi:hypothetical protein [Nocardia sp. CNY236]|uniref:hypothetical protein n=1 Tax=Nocardia sp. CNY236 TaxID=1169152 RepID=UPI0004205058|nr:hypothetical protein [Nocardia sp. CNY236]